MRRVVLLLVSLAMATTAMGGRPGGYVPKPTVPIFMVPQPTTEGDAAEYLEFPNGTSTVTRTVTIPPSGAWLYGKGDIPCDQTGFSATLSPQLGEYTPLFLAGKEGCYRSLACPWCSRLLWGGSPDPRYAQFDSYRRRIFLPEGTTQITVQPINSSSVNSSIRLFLGQWNCDALESMELSLAVDPTTPQILSDAEAANRIFVSGADDPVPLLLRFYNASKVEEYSVCPGTKIEYKWGSGARTLLMESGPTPALFVANVPVPEGLRTGTQTITVYATPKGSTRTYTATRKVSVYAKSLFFDADNAFSTTTPVDDLLKYVPGSELTSGASVALFNALGQSVPQKVKLYVRTTDPGTVKVEFVANTVSAFPGFAMNYPIDGATTDPDMDFGRPLTEPVELPVAKGQKWVSTELNVRDYGAKAKVRVTVPLGTSTYTYTVNVPRDKDKNKLPDAGWKALPFPIGPAESAQIARAEDDFDKDPPGVTTGSYYGDGLSAYEEYRGFVVGGQHIRTHPFVRDLFIDADNNIEMDLTFVRRLPFQLTFIGEGESRNESVERVTTPTLLAGGTKRVQLLRIRPVINPNRSNVPGARSNGQRALRVIYQHLVPPTRVNKDPVTGDRYYEQWMTNIAGQTFYDNFNDFNVVNNTDPVTGNPASVTDYGSPNETAFIEYYPQFFPNTGISTPDFANHKDDQGNPVLNCADPTNPNTPNCDDHISNSTGTVKIIQPSSRDNGFYYKLNTVLDTAAHPNDYYSKLVRECQGIGVSRTLSTADWQSMKAIVAVHEVMHGLTLPHTAAPTDCGSLMYGVAGTPATPTAPAVPPATVLDRLPLPTNFTTFELGAMRTWKP